eukprot:5728918-Amphidinium_carterae.1
MEAIFGCIGNHFAEFFNFTHVDDHSAATGDNKWHGKNTFCSRHHSVWHEDMHDAKEHEKYKRRIERFYQNPAERLLFIRSVNTDAELRDAPALLDLLDEKFPNQKVFLLMIIDAQHTTSRHVVRWSGDRLLVFRFTWHLIDAGDPYEGHVPAYEEPIAWAVEYVSEYPQCGAWKTRSLGSLLRTTRPYTCGTPQNQPWIPDVYGGSDSEGDPNPECPFQ